MKYTFTCPSPCNYNMRVEARTDEEAVKKIAKEGVKHVKTTHPEMGRVTEDELITKVWTGLRKE